ncbi:MAG TPA: hypothetical protein VGC42_32585 [Kofleriaceae bacterium]
MRRIVIEETTLRDGEQTPGVNFFMEDRLEIAHALSEILTEDDVLDSGFPAASELDAAAIHALKSVNKKQFILATGRMRQGDIDITRDTLAGCDKRQMALIVPSSKLHREEKLGLSDDALIDTATSAVRYARRFFPTVTIGMEDATRTEPEFLVRLTDALIEAGAGVITYADTVGGCDPWSYGELFAMLRRRVANIDRLDGLGAHCHDDLGLALANSLAALRAGANRLGCAFNGLGERAGNAATEEVLMCFKLHDALPNPNRDRYGYDKIKACSELVARLSGVAVQKHKAVVGEHCFAHESGIHQDGLLKNPKMYEAYDPRVIGVPGHTFVLGKQSGRRALASRLTALGVSVDEGKMDDLFARFKRMAERKKQIVDADLLELLS